MVRLLLRRRVVIADGGFSKRGERTGENDHRAIYHRTLSRSELVDSGEDREVGARAAAELQQDTRGPPEPGCDRADEFRGIAGPEPESRAQRRAWALAQIGGGAVSGRVPAELTRRALQVSGACEKGRG